ncbi:MAG: hypothetical protein IJZ57_03140 [Clostridia bacterium]|nr:hypothetical protein [Clostridia bacterium]
MKKGLCLVLSVLLIAVSFCSCSMIKDEDALKDYTYVDAQGNTHEYATNADGEVATQENGQKETTTTTTKAGGSTSSEEDVSFQVYATDKNGENVTDKNGALVTSQIDFNQVLNEMTKTTTSGKGSSNNSSSGGLTGSLENSDKNDLLEEGDKTSKTSLKAEVIDPIVKTKKYTLDTTIIAQDMEMPMVMCINGKDYAASLDMKMGTLSISARVFSKEGKYYLVIPMFGMYSEVDNETSEDISSPSGDLTASSTYVKSTKVKDGKTTYTCEEYKSSDGKTIKYYFNEKNEWKRWEVIDGEDISVFVINKFSGTINKSMFEIPKGLKKVDFDAIM